MEPAISTYAQEISPAHGASGERRKFRVKDYSLHVDARIQIRKLGNSRRYAAVTQPERSDPSQGQYCLFGSFQVRVIDTNLNSASDTETNSSSASAESPREAEESRTSLLPRCRTSRDAFVHYAVG